MYKPSGSFPFFNSNVFSNPFSKSACVTFILLSLKATNPASVHMALISAPDSSCFEFIKDSRLTSDYKVIFEVWI